MSCSICYEKFFNPKNYKEFLNMLRINVPKDCSGNLIAHKLFKFLGLLCWGTKSRPHICSITACSVQICGECFDELTTRSSLYKCPYCRNIDWKLYKQEYVLKELLKFKR